MRKSINIKEHELSKILGQSYSKNYSSSIINIQILKLLSLKIKTQHSTINMTTRTPTMITTKITVKDHS